MEEEIKKEEFSLTPMINPETKEYSIKKFDEVKVACTNFIKDNMMTSCKSDDDLKTLRKCRSNIRKKKDQIKAARVALTRLFTYQLKELESLLDEADNELKALKDEFEASKVEETPETASPVQDNELKKITFIIEYRDSNIIDSIKKLAIDNGCTITEIKEK